MKEQWKPIPGFENLYEVSDQGRVRSLTRRYCPRDRILQGHINRGYCRVMLSRKTREDLFLIHRLVLEAFVGPCPPNHVTHHKNGNKTDNRLENLEWTTQKRNVQHAIQAGAWSARKGEANPSSKLTADDVQTIRHLYAKCGCSYRKLAYQFGVSQWTIRSIIKRESWQHIA